MRDLPRTRHSTTASGSARHYDEVRRTCSTASACARALQAVLLIRGTG